MTEPELPVLVTTPLQAESFMKANSPALDNGDLEKNDPPSFTKKIRLNQSWLKGISTPGNP